MAGGGVGSDGGGSSAGAPLNAPTGGQQATGGAPLAGTAGDSALSGSAGQGGDSCQSKTSGDIRAWLFPEIASTVSNEIHPFIALTTTGLDVPLEQLAIRYYFTGEMSGAWQTDCIWVTQQAGAGGGLCDAGASVTIVSLDPPRQQADHYLELTFTQVTGAVLSSVPTPVFEARSMFWRDGHPMLNQANDYSFVPTTNEVLTVEARDYRQTSRVTVYRNGALVWGEEPCP